MKKEEFLWTTGTGKQILLKDMKTRHLMNTIRMLYNHLAKLVGLGQIQFQHEYNNFYKMWLENPQEMINGMKFMIEEMKDRIDNDIINHYDLLVFQMIKINLSGNIEDIINKKFKKLKGDTNEQRYVTS